MKPQTSIDAYNTIRENGLLSDLRFVVYEDIVRHPGTTQNEMSFRLNHLQPRCTQPRVSELQERGVIVGGEPRPCSITGNMAIPYTATTALPTEPQKKKSEKQMMRERIEFLESEVERLTSLLPPAKQAELFD